MLYDLIIIGAGPAGITAAVYAARKRMNFIVISRDIGGQAAWSGDIENYTGYQFITGPELVDKFEKHMEQYNVEVKEGETALSISKINDTIEVKTNRGVYQSKTAIVATGKKSKELRVPGEKEFKNKGISYCATCDGPIFAGKDVAVIGGGNSALDAAMQLMKIANNITIVNESENLTGDEVMREKAERSDKIQILNSHRVRRIIGDKTVTGIEISPVDSQDMRMINVNGVFVEIGLIPSSEIINGAEKNSRGEIIVDSENRTNIPGVFASGDVTNISEKQIIIAAGEGSKAALGAYKYIIRQK